MYSGLGKLEKEKLTLDANFAIGALHLRNGSQKDQYARRII